MTCLLAILALLTAPANADVLSRAIAIVEQAAPVPHRDYRIREAEIDGRGGTLATYSGGTIVLDRADMGTFDVVSVVAHEIACHAGTGLGHDARGRLTNPAYRFVRRPNRYDRLGENRTYRAPGIIARVSES